MLRLFHFFDDRSLWRDEIYLNLSLIKYSYRELATLPLYYEQKAPIGYLWVVKTFVLLLGKKEMALRLFSLICGIWSLVLMVPVARYFLKPAAAVLAVGLLALSSPLIYHSVEAKQYSTELLAAVLGLLLGSRYGQQSSKAALVKWALLGGMLMWFSFSVVFLLAGMAATYGLHAVIRKDWKQLFLYLIPFGWWFVNFVLSYFFFIAKYQDSGWLVFFFENVLSAFMPLPPASAADLLWFGRTLYLTLSAPLGLLLNFGNHSDYTNLQVLLRMPFLPMLLLLAGTIGMWQQDKRKSGLLMLPVLLTLLASGLKQYPFFERLLVFLAPVFLLLICYGAEKVARLLAGSTLAGRSKVMLALSALLLGPPCFNAVRELLDTDKLGGNRKIEYLRDAFLYVSEHIEAGDQVYVYWNARHAYQYYQDAYQLPYKALQGRDVRRMAANAADYQSKLKPDLARFAGSKRVWLIFDTDLRVDIGDFYGQPAWYYDSGFVPGKLLEASLADTGKKIAHFRKKGINAVLYAPDPGN